MAEANGVNVGKMKLYGVGTANALTAIAGALFAQIFGAADAYMGIGVIIVGLASVIVGMSILPSRTIILATFACLVGAVLYRLAVAVALNADFMVIVRGVNVFPTQIEELILKCAGLAPHYQIELSREGRLDTMTIKVEALADAATDEARNASRGELTHHVKSAIGVSATVQVSEPGGVERSAGKARRVIDHRSGG